MININNQKFTNILLLVLVLLNIGLGYALWQSTKRHHPPDINTVVNVFKAELNLTEEQTNRFMAVIDNHRMEHKGLGESQRQLRLQMVKKVISGDIDSLTLATSIEEIGEKQSDMVGSFVKQYQDLRAICTPEQKQKFTNLFKKRLMHNPRNRRKPR